MIPSQTKRRAKLTNLPIDEEPPPIQRRLTIAFLYNVRSQSPDPEATGTHLEVDFDEPELIAMMIRYLKKIAKKVIPIEANEKAYVRLMRESKKIDLVFNYAEGLRGQDREAQIPAMLEMLQIPYTGSGPLTQALVFNKAKTKEMLKANGIDVTHHQLLWGKGEPLDPKLSFPLMVKPVSQGSSAGITGKSIVKNEKELRAQIQFVVETFHQSALVEPFLEGREFSVSMLGNPPQILPIIEADHSQLPKEYAPIDSFEVKWWFEEQSEKNHLICPAVIEEGLRRKIRKMCQKTWKVLEIRDSCRIDIRCDKKGKPYILEVNSPAGLAPPEVSLTSYFPLSARTQGLSYEDLLKSIISSALKRYGKDHL